MTYLVRQITYEPAELGPEELYSMREAAELIGISLPALCGAMDRGQLTEVVDNEATNYYRGRRYAIRAEVAEYARAREERKAASGA